MSQDIDAVSNHYPKDPITFSSTYGRMEVGVTDRDGLKMSNAVEWLGRERLFETTVAHIIIFSFSIALIIGLFLGVVLTRNGIKTFVYNGVRYQVLDVSEVGIAKNGSEEKKIYSPIYEVKK